jgi:hypothetical protein
MAEEVPRFEHVIIFKMVDTAAMLDNAFDPRCGLVYY